MITRNNFKEVSLAALAFLALLSTSVTGTNLPSGVNCTGGGGCGKETGESDGDPGSASTNSVEITLNLGVAPLDRPKNFSGLFEMARFNYDDEDLPQGLNGLESYYSSNPVRGTWAVDAKLETPDISEASFKRSSLRINHDFRMEIIKDSGGVRQVLNNYFLVDFQDLPSGQEGFIAKWYPAANKGTKQGSFYSPTGAHVKEVKISNPTPTQNYNQLYMESGMEYPEGWVTRFYRFSSSVNNSGRVEHVLDTLTASPDNGGKVIERESLEYFSGAPVNGVEQKNQDRIKTISRADLTASGINTTGTPTLKVVSRYREVFQDIGGKKRMTSRMVLGSPTATTGGLETKMGYYDDPGDSSLLGRPKWELRPDGSWTIWKISGTASTQTLTTYTPFANGPSGFTLQSNGSNADSVPDQGCLIEEKILTSATSETRIRVGSQLISRSVSTNSTGSGGELVTKTERLAGLQGSGPNESDPSLVTVIAYNPLGNATAPGAGRIAWEIHDDGTATVYSYSSNGVGGVTVTKTTGATSSSGMSAAPSISAGTTTVTKFNSFWKEYEFAEYDGTSATGTASMSWVVTYQNVDSFGRPTDRIWSFGGVAGGSESFVYDCCGLKEHVARDGSITESYRDQLKRVYRVDRKTVAASPVVTTLTTISGLTTTTTRDGIFVSEVNRSLDGLETRTVNPSRTSGTSTGRLTSRTRTDAAARTTTQDWLSGTSPEVWTTLSTSTRYLDGKTHTVTGARVTDTTYTYAAHTDTTYGPGLKTTATSSGLVSQSFTDPLGRSFKTISPGSGTTLYTFHPVSASSGSRGRVHTMTDADGVSTTYGYDSEGERITTTRTVPVGLGHTATNLTSTTTPDIVASAGPFHGISLGASYRTISQLGGTTVATSYRSLDGLKSASVTLSGTTVSVATYPDSSGVATTTTIQPDTTKTITTTKNGLTDKVEIRTSTGGLIKSIAYGYDSKRRLISVLDSETGPTDYDLDDNDLADVTESGQPLQMTAANGDKTTYFYDIFGRPIQTDLQRGSGPVHSTHTSYDLAGNVAGTWGSQTYPTYRIYNDFNQLTKLRTYKNLTGEPTLATTAYAETEWIYGTTTGRLDRKEYHDGNGTDYEYSDAGRLELRTWERGITTEYIYTHGMLTSVDYSGTTPDVTYTYDALGRQASIANANATSEFDYADGQGEDLGLDIETITYTLPNPADSENPITFTRVLDRRDRSLGRDTGWELEETSGDPAVTTVENQVTYGYSATTGFLATVANGTDTFTYGYAYNQSNAASPRIGATSGAALGTMPYTLEKSGTTTLRTLSTYEAHRNVLDVIDNQASGLTVSKFDYTVNELGQRTDLTTTYDMGTGSGITPNPGSTSWTYDDFGQIELADSPGTTADRSYLFDSIGNRKQSADSLTLPGSDNYVSNALNQYTAVG
ncbi:RHS repeat domain-containing protein, partial [Haloferula sp.]|uniref:RHS repeat domain-containing protein n=1 Tax=Haloferula sp. TaxID=2497595 RepID=UPI003C73716B